MELTGMSRRILDAMDDDDARSCTTVGERDVLLLLPKMASSAPPAKSACLAGTVMNKRDQDAFIESIFLDADQCIEIIVFDQQDSLLFFDTTNPRWRKLGLQDLDENIISCFKRYMKTGNQIFLDPIFDDHVFKKCCWTAFQESMALLDSSNINNHEFRVRIVLQVLIISMFRQMNILEDNEDELGAIIQGMIENKAVNVDLSPAIIVDRASLPSVDLVQVLAPWQSIPGFPEQLDEMLICFLMERSLPENYKKKSGSYYTPRSWAWLACHSSLHAWLAKNPGSIDDLAIDRLKKLRILDPAMGSGDFLQAMVDVLINEMLADEKTLLGGTLVDWNIARLQAKIDHVFKDIIHGIDMNGLAVDITRARFFLNALKHAALAPGVNAIMNRFVVDLIQDDFLTRSMNDTRFDIIIGNPPYLMEVRNNQAIFRGYSKHPETSPRYEPKMDIFYFFMFKDIEILNERGIVCIFVQEYWLDRYHARHLREFIFSSTRPLSIILFKQYKVFQTAPGHHSMLFLACKQQPAGDDGKGQIATVTDDKVSNENLLQELIDNNGNHIHVQEVDVDSFYDSHIDKVYIEGREEQQFFERLHAMPNRFIDENDIQVGINIPQPFMRRAGKIEGIFVLTAEQVQQMNLSTEEQELLKPFHKATDIDAFSFTTREESFIIYTTNEAKTRVEKQPLVYPKLRAHLDHYKALITSDHKPYGLHRPRQPEWFEARSKIIGIRKTKTPKFAVVPQDYYMDQAALFIREKGQDATSLYYICAYLNSSIAFKMLGSMKSQGGQLQIDKSVLAKLPVPEVSTGLKAVISTLSSWLHVLGVLTKNANDDDIDVRLFFSIKRLLDAIFNEILKSAGTTTTMLEEIVQMLENVAPIYLEDYLVTRMTSASLPRVMTSTIDIFKLKKAIMELLQDLRSIMMNILPKYVLDE